MAYTRGWPIDRAVPSARSAALSQTRLTLDHRTQLLSEVPLFSGLSKRQLKDIARITDTVHFDAGYDIVVEDSPANFCCILVEGSVEVIKGGRRIAQMGPGELFGEMAVIDSGPRSATVRSLTEVLTIQIPRRAFADVASSDPRIQMRMLEVLARRLRNASKEIH